MAKIIKELDMNGGIKIKVAIDKNKAIMVSNYGKEMVKLYFKAKEAGKKVSFDYRRNAMIETFDMPEEEYLKLLTKDYINGMKQQKSVQEEIKNGTKN